MSNNTAPGNLVEIAGLRVSFPAGRRRPPVEVVHGVSLSIRSGECVALVGESGSGKSVTARSIVGLSGPGAVVHAERFEVDGQDVRQYSEKQWRTVRGRLAGLVSQDALGSLDPLRTMGAEIAESLTTHGIARGARAHRRVVELLTQVGVPDPELRASQRAYELSGGQRQRGLIASAIAAEPKLIIADEPTTALDVTVQAQVIALLEQRLAAGTAMLLVSHDLAVVAGIADRILVMRDGVVVETGTPHEVLGAPRHEYTQRLLAAIPSARSRGRMLSANREAPVYTPVGDNPAPVIEAAGLRKTFTTSATRGLRRKITAADDISFTVHAGEIVGLVGESGSGKSTCASLVLALTQLDGGEVRLSGQPWTALRERNRRPARPRVQLIAQDPLSSFDPRYSVGRIVRESLAGSGIGAAAQQERVVQVLRQVGLGEQYLDRYPRTMSGGQRQRVAIARALAPEPDIIICDEPVSALDVSIQAQVLDLLSEVRARLGTSLLFISHDIGVIHHLCDRVLVIKDGRIVEQGPVEEVFLAPEHWYTRQLMAAVPRIQTALGEPAEQHA